MGSVSFILTAAIALGASDQSSMSAPSAIETTDAFIQVEPGERALRAIADRDLILIHNQSSAPGDFQIQSLGRPRTYEVSCDDDITPRVLIQTELEPGAYVVTIFSEFFAENFSEVRPDMLNVVWLDRLTDEWLLAAATNVNDSPGYHEPIGDRLFIPEIDFFAASSEVGDYGVLYDASQQLGFAYANVDHPGYFSIRPRTCKTDCSPPGGDGEIGAHDLLALLDTWGTDDRWTDVTDDGTVDADDLVALLRDWGCCRAGEGPR